MMNLVNRYLLLCNHYCEYFGDFRWSTTEDALEYADGTTFVFTEEMAQFLDGFAATRLLHFAHVLHLMFCLRNTEAQNRAAVARLQMAFSSSHGTLRNAGVFFAHLCRDIPAEPGTICGAEVCERLRNTSLPVRWFVNYSSMKQSALPALGPGTFESIIFAQINDLSNEEMRHWFRHGTKPDRGVGEKIAKSVEPPQSLSGIMATLLQRPRLAAARSLVAQMLSALTLPHRQLAFQELPQGGYSDVTTKGKSDQILPSQFALDEIEFFRRFAEHELLYFRREEPHAKTQRELVLVLDQGVRTWGEIRLALAASVIAFSKQADRNGLEFRLAATSNGGRIIDPVDMDPEQFGELLESSDLSGNPGLALENVLETPVTIERDVVLLTHQRNLREEDVVAAARRANDQVRLFSVALNQHGNVELGKLRHGCVVPFRQFRVDFAKLHRQQEIPSHEQVEGRYLSWTGHVEPIPFPFPFGLTGRLLNHLFEFDLDGNWLVTVSQGGYLHAWPTNGRRVEVLPRGFADNSVFTDPIEIVGVKGGIAVIGYHQDQLVVFHYDFANRRCHCHKTNDIWDAVYLSHCSYYLPDHHCLIVDPLLDLSGLAIDLATGEIFYQRLDNVASRVGKAWLTYENAEPRTGELWIHDGSTGQMDMKTPWLSIDAKTGEAKVNNGAGKYWPEFVPVADGQPIFRNAAIRAALMRSDTLVVKLSKSKSFDDSCLHLFRGPHGTPLAEYRLSNPSYRFTLSGDGSLLAVERGGSEVQVVRVGKTAQNVLITHQGQYHPRQVTLTLGHGWLILCTGQSHFHEVRWDGGALELKYSRVNPRRFEDPITREISFLTEDTIDFAPAAVIVNDDPERFVSCQTSDVVAVLDRFGHVIILDRDEKPVCILFAFRNHIGAWMPDGACTGAASLIGGPPSPNADKRIGQALQNMSRRFAQ